MSSYIVDCCIHLLFTAEKIMRLEITKLKEVNEVKLIMINYNY